MTDAADLIGSILFFIIKVVVSVFLDQRLQVIHDRVVALLQCQLRQDASCSLALAVTADGAVADVATGRALPVGILESSSSAFSVPIAKTDAAELAPDSVTFAGTAHGFHV